MTSGFAGGYKMESSEARALRSINTESYDYRDQGKLLTKLTSDVTYMAQYMRQMQKGIDDANANFIEQIGDFINEIIVVIGGNGNTGFDFGDLKYVLQAIGALFGFDQQTGIGAVFPINLFNAAWHFFSTYVLPLNNFGDAVDNFIDSALATILDVLGEIPVVGQAAQILATWISDLRDGVTNVGDAINNTIDDLTQLISDLWTNPAAAIQSISQSMVTGLQGALSNLNNFIQNLVDNLISALGGIPVIGGAITAVGNNIKALFQKLFRQDTPKDTVDAAAVPALDGAKIQSGSVAAARIADLDAGKITTGAFGSARISDGAVSNAKLGTDISGDKIVAGTVVAGRIGNLDGSKITTGQIGTAIVPNLDAGKITSGAFGTSRFADGAVSNAKLGTDISGDKIVAGTVVAGRIGNLDGSKITTGQIGTAIVPNLDAGKITSGAFADSRIPTLDAAKIGTGAFGTSRISDGAISNVKLGTDISGDKIVAGTVVAGRIGVLDASKVTTGNFDQNRVNNLTTDLSTIDGKAVTAQTNLDLRARDFSNMVAGSDFEGSTIPWPVSPVIDWAFVDTSVFRSGTASYRITGTSSSNLTPTFDPPTGTASPGRRFEVKAGEQLYVELWAKKSANYSSGSNTDPRFRVVAVAPTQLNLLNISFNATNLPTTDWTRLSATVTIPTGYTAIDFRIQGRQDVVGSVWIDDIVVRRVNTSDLIANNAITTEKILDSAVTGVKTTSLDGSKITTGVFNDILIPNLNASKINAGTFLDSLIPSLNASKITAGTFLDGLIPSLNASKITAGTFLGSLIPSLDVSKITTGVFGDAFIPSLAATKITSGTFVDARIPSLDGSKITSGSVAEARIASLSTAKITSGTFTSAFIADSAITNIKLGTDISGDKIVAGTVVAARVGVLDASKVTTGNFAQNRVTNLTTDLSTIDNKAIAAQTNLDLKARDFTNLFAGSDFEGATVPWSTGANFSVATDQFYSGTKSLKITGGSTAIHSYYNDDKPFEVKSGEQLILEFWAKKSADYANTGAADPRLRIGGFGTITPNTFLGHVRLLPADLPTTGWTKLSTTITIPAGVSYIHHIFIAPAANSMTGTLWVDDIVLRRLTTTEYLAANAVTTAKLADSAVTGAKTAGLDGSKITGGTVAADRISNLDAAKIASGSFVDARIPSLNASKITAGTFLDGLIPSLNASKITAGTFLGTLIPGLDVSKITSGVFGDTFIPNLAASKITSGAFADARIPNLDAAKIASGSFVDARIPGLDASKITGGTLNDTRIPTLAQTKVTSLVNDLADRRKLADTQNLAVDPGYEFGIENLVTGSCTRNTTDGVVRNGTAAIKFVSTGSGNSRVYVTSQSSAKRHQCSNNSDVFYVEMWIIGKAETNPASTTGAFQIYAGAYTAANTFIQWVSGPVITLTTALNNTWTQVAGYLTLPATCRQFEVFGQFQGITNVPAGYTFYVDDVILREVTDANQINKALYGSSANVPASTIIAGAVPAIDGSKINTGTLAEDRIASLSAGKITSGTFVDARIPSLDAAKITTGSFVDARIPNLAATKITSGAFGNERIAANAIATANIQQNAVTTNLINTGAVTGEKTAGLDASKITGGQMAQAQVSNLTTDLTTTRDLARGSLISGSNIVSNPGFESTNFWGGTNFVTNIKRSGSRSGRITADGVNYGVIYVTSDNNGFITVPTVAGDVFYVEAYVVRQGVAPTTGNIWIQADIYNSAGTAIGYPNNGQVAATSISTNTSAWTKISGYITMPANTAAASFMVVVGNTVTSGAIFYFDDVVVKEVTTSVQTNVALYNQNTPLTNIQGTALPVVIDASKLSTGTLPAGAIGAGSIDNTKIASGVDAAKLTTGTLPVARIADGALGNAKLASDIDAAKLTAGTLPVARIADGAVGNAKLASDIAASKIASGTLADARIPNLSTAKITSGTFSGAFIANNAITNDKVFADLDASKILSGTLNEARVQNLSVVRTQTETTIINIATALTGETNITVANTSEALLALQKTYTTLDDLSRSVQDLQAEKTSAQVKGAIYKATFSTYANGALPNSGAGTETFNTIYSGAGTSLIGVQNGIAQWYNTNNANRDAKIIWQKPTNTDFQRISGTMSAAPQQPGGGATTPKFHAIGRVNAAGTTFVWARAYCDGFLSYKGEIGCTVSGTETVWATNIPLTWSLDMRFTVGVGTNARQYQVHSGSTLVWTHTESGSASTNYTTKNSTSAVQSTLGSSNRLWGAIAQIRGGTGGPYHSGKVSGTSTSDNESPAVNGSVARMWRSSTSVVSFTGGNADNDFITFFDIVEYESPDIDADTSTGTFTVTESKAYLITARLRFTSTLSSSVRLILKRQLTSSSTYWLSQVGSAISNTNGISASWMQYLNAGERVRLCAQQSGVTVNVIGNGQAESYFSIAGVG